MPSLEKSQLICSQEDAVAATCHWYQMGGIEEMPAPTGTELHEDRFPEAVQVLHGWE